LRREVPHYDDALWSHADAAPAALCAWQEGRVPVRIWYSKADFYRRDDSRDDSRNDSRNDKGQRTGET
jgi:hypothetical protein